MYKSASDGAINIWRSRYGRVQIRSRENLRKPFRVEQGLEKGDQIDQLEPERTQIRYSRMVSGRREDGKRRDFEQRRIAAAQRNSQFRNVRLIRFVFAARKASDSLAWYAESDDPISGRFLFLKSDPQGRRYGRGR